MNKGIKIHFEYLRKLKSNIFVIMIVVFFITESKNIAQEIPELFTDRPDQTESPFVVPFDALQIETGFIYQKQKYLEGEISFENDNLILATTLCRYGVNSFMELRFGGEYFIGKTLTNGAESNLQGIQNILLGVKFNFRRDEKIFSNVGIIFQSIIPFGNEKLRPDRFAPIILFAVDQKINSDFSLGCNLGAESVPETERYNFVYTASLAYDINERLGSFFEFYGSSVKQSSPSNNLDCGITYLLKKNVQVDFSFGTTLMNGTTDFFGSIGFSIRIPN